MKKKCLLSFVFLALALMASAQCGLVYWNVQDGYRFDLDQNGEIDLIVPTQSIGKNISNIFVFDADGDGVFDLCEVDNSGALIQWNFYYNNGDNTFGEAQVKEFGIGGGVDKQLAGDFNNDGIGDVAIRRDNEWGCWWIIHFMGMAADVNKPFGITSADYLLAADFNGDGIDDIMCYDAGKWKGTFTLEMMPSLDVADVNNMQFGTARDFPVVGDFDGDGYADMGLFSANDEEIGINLHKTSKSENGGYSNNGRGSFDETKLTPTGLNATVVRAIDKKTPMSTTKLGQESSSVIFPSRIGKGGELTLFAQNETQLVAIDLFDCTGRQLLSKALTSNYASIQISQSQGIYVVKIKTDKGAILSKIVVE